MACGNTIKGKNELISWKSNNWYEREDGLIEIINFSCERIVLNEKYKLIWEAIDYEIDVEELWEFCKNTFDKEEFIERLELMTEKDIICIENKDDSYNRLFG
ncbi:plasmid rolling circle replication initiator protein Rep [Clostridium punense]|uniref:Plasmid rolling circle replication initiator protein Rep n=1 Tax=Clostridium punense TaxID=1054297 RepID=A0ABS4K4G9_9CLOT|nr:MULTISPECIES: hypothetical protein [Clostridium]EQB89720.1 hypothetical protein M918_19160 [Clostridium sp. BL8]MBP2021529.1 plasmid rolling circle replication initiator protein Rep [Clostridium punense]